MSFYERHRATYNIILALLLMIGIDYAVWRIWGASIWRAWWQ